MNIKQKRVLGVGIFLIALMGLFPPWIYTYKSHNTYQEKPGGYHFILTPPPQEHRGRYYGVRLDTSRFLAQLVTVSLIIGGLYMITGEKKSNEHDEQKTS